MCDTLAGVDIDPEVWSEHRSYLMAVAYRLLGTVSEAEDVVQEAYLRMRRYEHIEIVDVRRRLTTVVSRICLDNLRSARARCERYLGIWLPEPLLQDGAVLAVASITVTSGKVAAIYVVLNPDKLRHVNSASLHEPS